MSSQHPPREDSAQTTLTLHRNAAGLLEERLPPFCLACGAPATEAHRMHWDVSRNIKSGGIIGGVLSEALDVPLCPEHLAWYERRRRQLLLLGIPFILGANFYFLSLLLVHLTLVDDIVSRGLLIAGGTILFIGLCLVANYWFVGRKSIQAVRITGDTLKLDGVSPKVVDWINQQWEQRTLQGLQESQPPLARPVKKEEPPFDWQDVTG
jgi:hypothetical protein